MGLNSQLRQFEGIQVGGILPNGTGAIYIYVIPTTLLILVIVLVVIISMVLNVSRIVWLQHLRLNANDFLAYIVPRGFRVD